MEAIDGLLMDHEKRDCFDEIYIRLVAMLEAYEQASRRAAAGAAGTGGAIEHVANEPGSVHRVGRAEHYHARARVRGLRQMDQLLWVACIFAGLLLRKLFKLAVGGLGDGGLASGAGCRIRMRDSSSASADGEGNAGA